MSINCCLNKQITANISYQQRHPLFIVSNNAKGCYNCIHHVVGMLELISFGVPWWVCYVLFEVLKNTMHSIQTAHGTAPNMCGDINDNLNGIGQGNDLGPALWAVIWLYLIKVMSNN